MKRNLQSIFLTLLLSFSMAMAPLAWADDSDSDELGISGFDVMDDSDSDEGSTFLELAVSDDSDSDDMDSDGEDSDSDDSDSDDSDGDLADTDSVDDSDADPII